MNTISYCTTCKGRLWQLEQTIFENLKTIESAEGVDMVLLDYNSEDGLKDFIVQNFKAQLESGKLKFYQLAEQREQFDMSYAKNVVHKLATGQVLFNLDADNYVGTTINELQLLSESEICIARYLGNDTSRCGRIGIHASQFKALRGYNEQIFGLANDDGEFVMRALMKGLKPTYSLDQSLTIANTQAQKRLFAPVSGIKAKLDRYQVNITNYGVATIKGLLGNTFNI